MATATDVSADEALAELTARHARALGVIDIALRQWGGQTRTTVERSAATNAMLDLRSALDPH